MLFIGKTFADVAGLLSQSRNRENPAVLLGVKRKGKLFVNPRPNDIGQIETGDRLVVMAYEAPDLMFLADAATSKPS